MTWTSLSCATPNDASVKKVALACASTPGATLGDVDCCDRAGTRLAIPDVRTLVPGVSSVPRGALVSGSEVPVGDVAESLGLDDGDFSSIPIDSWIKPLRISQSPLFSYSRDHLASPQSSLTGRTVQRASPQ